MFHINANQFMIILYVTSRVFIVVDRRLKATFFLENNILSSHKFNHRLLFICIKHNSKFIYFSLKFHRKHLKELKMRVRKPQSKGTGGNLAKDLKSKEKNSTKTNLTTSTAKQSLLNESSSYPLKTVPTKKSAKETASIKQALTEKIDKSTKKSTKQKKKAVDKNDKKAKLLNKSAEQETVTSMGLNASKEKSSTTTKKAKSEKKTTTTTAAATNNEKKSIKDDNKVVPKSNKELKNLDIQLTGYSSVKAASIASDSDTDKVINASICEIVKTKARAASSTFNVSGNRSPLLVASSPSPSAMKPVLKSNSDKTPIKSDAKTVKDEENVKKVAATVEKVIPLKEKKSQTSNKDEKKMTNVAKKSVKVDGKEKKSIDNKIAPKIQKKKVKQASQTNEPKENKELTVSTEKSTDIKTKVDDPKSLIDSITEVINEVVNQYNDSNAGAEKSSEQQLKNEKFAKSTNSQENVNKKKKANKSTGTKNTKATAAGKKLLNQKKLNVIHEASDLVTDDNNSMKNLAKKNKINKLKMDKDAQNVEKDSLDGEAGAKKQQKIEKSKEIKMESKKTGNESSAMTKPKSKVNKKAESKATKNDSVSELKGSKIIKIATKAKKKAKLVAGTAEKPVMKLVKKALVPAKETENVKKAETVKQITIADALIEKTEDLSDDDNLSLNELKAQLTTANDAKNSSVSSPSKENSKQSKASIKSTLIGSGSKQKNIKKTLQKSSTEKNSEDKLLKPQRKDIKPDVYDFHESGHSSEDTQYVHKKNRAELNVQTKKSEKVSKPKDGSEQKSAEIVKKMPIKKRIDALAKEANVVAKAKPKSIEKAKDAVSNSQTNAPKNKSNAKKKEESESSVDNDNEKDKKPKKLLAKTRAATNQRKLKAKNRRMKLFGFYSGPKRHRMASLNALAKVQCLYENESRTAQELGFVKEPQSVHRMKIVSEAERNIDHHPVKEDPKHKEPEQEKEVKIESKPEKGDSTISDRTLRKAPGMRGEGSMWEMDSSLDESDRDDDKLVSFFFVFPFKTGTENCIKFLAKAHKTKDKEENSSEKATSSFKEAECREKRYK